MIKMINIKSFIVIPGIFLVCAFYTRAQTNIPGDTLSGKTLNITIASEPAYPPFCVVDKNGRADGFAIELFKAVAYKAHIDAKINIGIRSKIKDDLAKSKIDALPLVARTPEQEELFDFTFPYITLNAAVFVRKGTKGIRSLSELKGKEIIVMKGDKAEEYLRLHHVSETIITTQTFAEAFRLLADGNYDAVVTHRLVGLRLMKDLEITNVVPLDFPVKGFQEDFCFAVKKGDTALLARLNEGLSVVIANGTYDKIYIKWFGPVNKERFTYTNLINFTIYIFIPLIALIALIAVYVLRRLVRRRTKSLRDEILEHKKTETFLHSRQMLLTEMEKVSKVGGWEYDPATKKVTWTDGVYAIYGVSSAGMEPSEKGYGLDYLNPEDKDTFKRAFSQTLETGEPFDLELHLNAADGTLKQVRTSCHAEFKDGEVVSIFGNVIDISRQKKVENDLRKLTDELEALVSERTLELSEKVERLDKSQKALLYMVEDLNQVTAELKQERLNLETVNRELDLETDDRKHFTEIVVNSSNNLLSIITDIVNMATIEAGQVSVNKNVTDVNSVLNLLQKKFLAKFQSPDVDFRLTTPLADSEVQIITDKTKFTEIISNLAGNALKFTKTGFVNVGYNLKGEFLEFYVEDTGIGIAADMQTVIFDRFRQVESTLAREYGGSGLGLSIAKAYIELLGGKLWMESESGKGSTFYFTIPYKRNSTQAAPAKAPVQYFDETDKPKTILIAEGEDSNYMLLEVFLKDLKIRVIRAKDGVEAVEICKLHSSIDLVLMDLKMPVMDGYQATKKIRKLFPHLPVIAQTAYNSDANRDKAAACGCTDYISKPIERQTLLYKLHKHLDK